jgi:anion-transporting  ArsA/GET3 family ATPase
MGPTSAFFLIAGPGDESLRQTTRFLDRLESFGVPLAGVLVNRIHQWPSAQPPIEGSHPSEADIATLRDALAASEGSDFPAQLAAEAAAKAATGYAALVRSDAQSTQPLRERIANQNQFWACIPEFEEDVHDLVSLGRIADQIMGRQGEFGCEGE